MISLYLDLTLIYGGKMKFNKLIGILLIVFVLMFMSVVSAAEDMDNQTVVGADEVNLDVEQEIDISDTHETSNEVVLGDGNAGNSWYVQAGKTGGDGSQEHPYGNLKSVTNNANYGENDIIYVMEGTYSGSNNYGISLKENTTVKAYDGTNPIFDAKNQASVFKISSNGVVIKGLTFINGGGTSGQTAEGKNAWCGGAIFNSGDNLVIDNCTIKNNDPITYGGGVYSKGKNTEIKFSTFEGCEAVYGGAIAIDGPYAKIVNNTFNSNAGSYGGAINIFNYGEATIANNSFNRNRASGGYGGGIYARAGNNYISNSTFNRNTAKTYGGAIITVNANTVIDNCTFIANQIFNDNSNTNWGGAIYSQGTNTQILNSKFIDNAVRDNGGAICVRNNDNLIKNCTFDKNWAARGGAIFINQIVSGHNITNTTVDRCTFNENGVVEEMDGEPNMGTKGGAIYSWGIDTHVTNSNFTNNKAMIGGAILYERGINYLENNTFIGNAAYRYGGGAISSTRFGDVINNCTFKDNFAQGYGGAVSADYPTITNSKFINNHGNHGGAICTITANVSDCEFYDNSADDNWVVLAATKLIESNNIHPGQVAISMNHTEYRTMEYDVENEIAIMPGYYAYCMEEYADYPQYGVLWENLRYAQNSITEERVGEYLKILILKYWEDETHHSNLQKLVNIFTDRDYENSDNEIVREIMDLYDSGYRVPTVNALRFYDNGTVAIFNFKEIITPSATQNVFAFNITYNPNLTVKKEIITTPAFVNSEVKFNITVKNTGECNLTSVWINETDFSDGLKYVSFNSPYNWTYDNQTKLWTLNDELPINQTAYIILTFNVIDSGNMTNNVSSGIGNYSFANDTVSFKVYRPSMKVEKITLISNVYIGKIISFKIIVTNTGDYPLGDIFVKENYGGGLKLDSYDGEDWTLNGNTFYFNNVLNPGESSEFIVFFKTTKAGNLLNFITAGSNVTNNQTINNTTNIIKNKTENIPENSTNDTTNKNHTNKTSNTNKTTTVVSQKDIHTNKTVPDKQYDKIFETNVEKATGNPIFALLVFLLVACVNSIRKFKK